MPRYYCDYCDTYLTHDSPVVRKQHNTGYKHKANVRNYYMQFEEAQTQDLIDSKILEHLAKAGLGDPSQMGGAPMMGGNPLAMRPPGAGLYPGAVPGQSQYPAASLNPAQTPQPPQQMQYRPPVGLPPPGQPMYRPPQSMPPPQQYSAPYPAR